jgi:hypothetical protein
MVMTSKLPSDRLLATLLLCGKELDLLQVKTTVTGRSLIAMQTVLARLNALLVLRCRRPLFDLAALMAVL